MEIILDDYMWINLGGTDGLMSVVWTWNVAVDCA